jgi:hypothetical protein
VVLIDFVLSRDWCICIQRTDVGTYSIVNRTIKDWNSLPAGIPASFPCKLNTFRKRVRKAVASTEALGGV